MKTATAYWGKKRTHIQLDGWDESLLSWHYGKSREKENFSQLVNISVQGWLMDIGVISPTVEEQQIRDETGIFYSDLLDAGKITIKPVETHQALLAWCKEIGSPIAAQIKICLRRKLQRMYGGELRDINKGVADA